MQLTFYYVQNIPQCIGMKSFNLVQNKHTAVAKENYEVPHSLLSIEQNYNDSFDL